MTRAAATRTIDSDHHPAFTLAIDATKVAKLLEVSSFHKGVIGGAHPNQNIDISNLSKDNVDAILQGTFGSTEICEATEIKVAIMSFQSTAPGMPPSIVVAARPQSNNECSDFVQGMEQAAITTATSAMRKCSFAGFTVDGVSSESNDVRRSICDFLSCKIDHVGSTDTNHNQKSMRYQYIGGSGTVCIGVCVVDSDLLRLAGIAKDLWRPNDFASDLLVLNLASYNSVKKLHKYMCSEGSDFLACDMGSLMVTLVMARLRLYAINGKCIAANWRAVYSWVSLIWFTSLDGVCMTTKRNLVSEAIPFAFLLLRNDIENPRNATSEPAEHEFGNYRTKAREFTTLDFCHLVSSNERRSNMMFASNFQPNRDPQKGYQATHGDWVRYNTTNSSNVVGGPVVLSDDGCAVAEQLWDNVYQVISCATSLVTPILLLLGVNENDISPFCRNFESLTELRDAFIEYCPRTFSYDGAVGSGDADIRPETSPDVAVDPDLIAKKIRSLATDLLGSDSTDATAIEVEVTAPAPAAVATDSNIPVTKNVKILQSVESLCACTDINDLGGLALSASSALESKENGSISGVRKFKSLRNRWFCNEGGSSITDSSGSRKGKWIERGTLVSIGVIFGRGATKKIETFNYRVLTVYDKSYNKWFMTGERKKWSPDLADKEKKKYRFEVRMLNDNILGLEDVELDSDAHRRKDIVRLVDGSMVVAVIGKLTKTSK